MIYDKIYFIGTGRVGRACLTILANYCTRDELCCVSVDKEDVPVMKMTSERLGIGFSRFEKTTLHKFLLSLREKVLIISAHNKYIFPKDVVKKINITIINFHNAYLPEYRGRNAPTWEIYNQEKYGGATWHLVEPEIDTGDIIVQRKVPINADDTALDLLIRSAETGIALLRENVVRFLSGDYILKKSGLPGKLYLANQLPNDGWLNVNWSMTKAYAFLRAMDYRGMEIVAIPKVKIGGEEYAVESYKLGKCLLGGGQTATGNNRFVQADGTVLQFEDTGRLRLKQIKSYLDIKNAITQIKDIGDDWFTNMYISDDELTEWIGKKQLIMLAGDTTFFILRKRESCFLLYFAVSSRKMFQQDIAELKNIIRQVISVDIIYRREYPYWIVEGLKIAGFTKGMSFKRMYLKKAYRTIEDISPVEYAGAGDVKEIKNILYKYFNAVCEQLPDEDEIIVAVAEHQIYVTRKADGNIISVSWFVKNNNNTLLRYWIKLPQYRNGYSSGMKRLLSYYGSTNRLFVWVREDNIRACEVYQHLGFIYDGLIDEVYYA